MNTFMDENFLLNSETAKKLYHDYAKKQPIIDYHCHIDPKEIAEDINYKNITQVWLGGDHYKWRLMRAAGVSEKYITGNAPDKEKFQKWAEVISKAIGNPLYHWSHLELQRYFGYHGLLNRETADEVWGICNEQLSQQKMSARNIIRTSNVEVICTTDDPIDSLEWHQKIASDQDFTSKVFPTWRPDKAMNIEKDDFCAYIEKLSEINEVRITSFSSLKNALKKRMAFFNENGCRLSDHGLEYVYCSTDNINDDKIENIFKKRLNNTMLTTEEIYTYKTAFMLFSGEEACNLGWAMQLHYGCKRNNNGVMLHSIGPDTGFDCMNNYAPAAEIANYLDALNKHGKLPKTIIYSLNPNDNQIIDSISGCFQDGSVINKIQHGSAWWFNDHKEGMRSQMISLGNIGYLAGFLGMLTDSRSMISYPRHEYFRRVLCDLLGGWVESGELPNDMQTLGAIVSDISYGNAKNYFCFTK